MAEQVVKDLRVTAREEGVQLVANRLTALQGASRAAAASISEVGVATEQSARRTASSTQAMSRYAERMAVNSKAVRDYLRDQKALNGGLASGALSVQGYARELQRIQQAFQNFRLPGLADQSALNELLRVRSGVDGVTNAARESARAFEEAFARQKAWGASLDQSFGFDRIGQDASDAAASFEELFRNQEKVGRGFRDLVNQRAGVFDGVTRSAREASAAFDELIANQDRVARQVRSGIDARLGIGRAPGRSAEDSMDAFVPMFRQEEAAAAAYAKRLAEVRAQIDPLTAAQQRLTTELAEYQAMAARGDLSSADLAKATEMANDGFQIQAVRIGAVGEAAKLTGNQMLNLSRQANDVATMAAMGMPISMIVTSQLGQIYGALEENSRGVRGSIEAISNAVKGFFAGLGPVGIALGALGVAAVAFGLATRRNVEPIEDVIKGQADAVRDLREAYGLAGDAAAEYVRRSPQAVRVGVVSDNEDALRRAREEIENRRTFQFSGMENERYTRQTERFGGMKQAFDNLIASAAAGTPRFTEFEDALAKIAESDIDDHARDVIKANLEWVRSLVPLQNELVGMERSLDAGAVAIERMGVAFDRAMDKLRDFAPAVSQARQIDIAFEEAAASARTMSELIGAVDAREGALAELARPAQESLRALQEELASLDLSPLDRELARVMADYDRQFDERQRTANDAAGLAALLAERDVALQIVRREHAIEAAEKSREEAEQYRKASAERLSGIQGTVEALEMERSLLGRSEGEIAAARFAYESLNEAKRAAAAANSVVSPEEIAAIQQAASSIGGLTDQLVAMREAQANAERIADTIAGLQFQGSLIGLPEVDQQVARQLHQLKLSYDDLDGQRIAGAIRYNASLTKTQEGLEKQRQIVENVASTFLDIFTDNSSDGFFDRILKGLADIGRQFAELGKQKLMETLFGGALGYTGGQLAPGQRSVAQPGFPGGLLQPANQNVPAASLNLRSVTALNDNLQRSSRSALDVARQFDGLNERADSAVLDSFMQASGNWRNLSAADTAWCAAFANAAIAQAGGKGTNSNLASSFMGWGQGTNTPQVGDIVVLKPQARGASGHVGFVAGFGDGTVQVFGGNQSNAANTRSFGLDQVRGYRTGVGVSGAGVGGSVALQPDPWSGLRTVTPGSNVPQAANTGWFGQGGRLSQIMQSPVGQLGMMGLGAFGTGYQSGSAGGGALQSGLTGFMTGGPIGGLVGLAGGLLGGLFGGRARRRQEHQQRAEAWAQMAPQWAEFQERMRTGMGPASGLRAAYADDERQFAGFVQTGSAAWRNGSNNSSQLFSDVSQSRQAYQDRTNQQFRERFWPALGGLESGQGLDGPFVQARESVVELGKTLVTFIDDASVAFGEGSVEAARASQASITYMRTLLGTGVELSEVGARLQEMDGIAAGMRSAYDALGVSAQDAARAIEHDLKAATDRLRSDFTTGLQDQIDEMDGRGYLAGFRELINGVQTTMRDAALLGADTSLVDTFFAKSAQSLVNQAQLSGEAFNELVAIFPQLTGLVREFSAAAEEVVKRTTQQLDDLRLSLDDRVFAATIDTSTLEGSLARFERNAARERAEELRLGGEAILELERALAAERGQIVRQFGEEAASRLREQAQSLATSRYDAAVRARSEAEGALRREYERTVAFVGSVKGFLDDMRLDESLSTLSAKDRLDEAGRQYRETLALAQGGDVDAQGRLVSASEAYLREARDYYATSERYGAIYAEIEGTLKTTLTKVETELDIARRQASFLNDIAGGQKTMTVLLAEYLAANREAMRQFANLNQNRDWGLQEGFNRSLVDALSKAGLQYTGGFGNGQFAQWQAGLSPADRQKAEGIGSGLANNRNWGANEAANRGYVNSLASVGLHYSGNFGSGGFGAYLDKLSAADREKARGAIGFQSGGFTGMGALNAVAGVVHGQEFVAHAEATRRWRPQLEAMNAGAMRLPEVAMPRVSGTGNGEMLEVLRSIRAENIELRKEVASLRDLVGASDDETRAVIRSGNRQAKKTADALALEAA